VPARIDVTLAGPAARRACGPAAREAGGARRLRAILRRAARATLAAHGVADAELSFALIDDDAMARLHERHLHRAGPTDVLAFALHGPGEPVVGDIYIACGQAARQAAEHRASPLEELVRLAVHGTLHVLGHDHPTGPARVRSPMWRTQERIVREVLGP